MKQGKSRPNQMFARLENLGKAEFNPAIKAEIDALNARILVLTERGQKARAVLKKLFETGEVADPGAGLIEGGDGGTAGGPESGFDPSQFDERIQAAKASVDEFTNQMAKWKSESISAFNSTRDPLEALLIKLKELRANPFIDGDLQQRSIQDPVELY